jgi:hypothetical protein
MQNIDPQEQERRTQRTNLQREIMMQEADLRKISGEKKKAEDAIRALKKDRRTLDMQIEAQEAKIKKIDQEVMMRAGDIKSLKKKVNLI